MAARNIQAIYPLTPMQEGILFHTLESPAAGTYFNQFTCRFDGPLDIERFERAWQAAFARHAALRTLFTWEKRERPLQIVRKRVELPFATLDWCEKDRVTVEADLEAFLESDRNRGFELDVAPLSRISLIRLDDGLSQMVWSFHHIVLDGWSVLLLIDEVMKDYHAARNNIDVERHRPSFENFVSWRKTLDQSQSVAFWRDLLDGFTAPTTPEIRLRRDATDVQQGRPGQQTSFTLGAQFSEQLRVFAQEQRVTLNTVLVAAWSILLSSYCGARDVVFGTTVSGRSGNLDGIDQVIGLLINTLPVRVQLDEGLKVVDLLREVLDQQVQQQAFEQTSLQEIRRCSQVPASMPLFESILVFENVPNAEAGEQGTPKLTDKRFIEHSNFPLALLVLPAAKLELLVVHDGQRYSRRAVEQILQSLDHILQQLVDSQILQVDDVSATPPEERQRLLRDGNGVTSCLEDSCQSVVQLFERSVRAAPDAVALTDASDIVTYAELNRKANRLARYLQDRHRARGRPLLIHAQRSVDAIVAMLASLKSGAVYVPMDVNMPGARLRQIAINLARGFASPTKVRPLILTQPDLAADLPTDIVDVEFITAADSYGDDSNLDIAIDANDLAYVIYTSGSTGEPKGVMVQHGALLNSNIARFEFYDDQPDSFALVSSLATDSSLAGIYWTLCAGGKLVIPPSRTELDIEQLTARIQAEAVSHILCVPSLYELLLDNADLSRLRSLRVVVVAGEASNDILAARHRDLLPKARLFNEYGPSEACVWATAAELDAGPVSIGTPIANTTTYVLDAQRRVVPRGVAGELHIGGANLALGYLGQPDTTSEAFIEDPFAAEGSRMYRTGDKVRTWDDGRLEFLGRCDQQIKIRGFRIEPGEVEAALVAHPDIKESVVYKHQSASAEQLVAVVAGSIEESDGLRDFCSKSLPGYMVPQQIAVVEQLPKTATGKTDRTAIQNADWFTDFHVDSCGVAPRTPEEEALAAIWRDVIGLEEIYVFDNFFEIGGDSLMTIRILSRASREGLKIAPEQFFQHPTIAAQAALVDKEDNDVEMGPAAPGPAPLLPIQHWFFSNVRTHSHHWNQSYLFEIDEAFETLELERAIATLLQRHDSLRTQFCRSGSTWLAEVVETAGVSVELVALEEDNVETRKKRIVDVARRLNSGFELGRAPLLRACHFADAPGKPNFLLLVIHHLLVDVESWRILMADLEALLKRQGYSEQAALQTSGTSVSRWGKTLQALANSSDLDADSSYWTRILQGGVTRIPTDGDRSVALNRERDTVIRSFTIDAVRTADLQQTAREALRASFYQVIVSTVARMIAGWTGAGRVVFDTEGHGREPVVGGDGGPTAVGWLTSVFPLVFDTDKATWDDAFAALRLVKEKVSAIPRKGVTLGILRYLVSANDDNAVIHAYEGADVLFNYLGDVGIEKNGDAILSLTDTHCGQPRSPECERAFLLEINAYLTGGELIFEFSYSKELFATETIDALGQQLVIAMQEIADAARDPDKDAIVASDFPLADLSAADLASIASQLDELEE
jgi:amino acid adenylation domain-containing protein/non-ribosomal peptide synthase protein (TIGR01720 family)